MRPPGALPAACREAASVSCSAAVAGPRRDARTARPAGRTPGARPIPRPPAHRLAAQAAAPAAAGASTPPPPPPKKELWLQTTSPQAAVAAIEAGVTTLVFESDADAAAWAGMAAFRPVVVGPGAGARPLTDARTGAVIGTQRPIADAPAAAALADSLASQGGCGGGGGGGGGGGPPTTPPLVWAAAPPGAWSMIPTENLVAALGGRAGRGGADPDRPRLFVSAPTAAAAAALLGALEAGADGAVLVSDDPAEARAAAAAVAAAAAEAARPHVALVPALVTAVAAAGMGDRVCVDLTTAMAPGEGLLVGSYARGLALVQAEVEPGAGYVAARPFRVNAGAIHSYVAAPGGRTAYLAELAAGTEVLVVDGATGVTRTGVVGRAKVERRPLTRVTLSVVPPAGAAPSPGDTLSLVAQNAETVRLVGPAAAPLPPDAAEAVRWAMGGGGGPAASPPPAARLRRSESATLRWAMGEDATSSAEEEDGDGDDDESRPPRRPEAAPPAASDALAWLMRDADGDGLPDDPDVDVSGMDEGLAVGARRGGGGARPPPPPPPQSPGARACATTPVSALAPGTAVWVWRAPPARHTGIAVDEAIEER